MMKYDLDNIRQGLGGGSSRKRIPSQKIISWIEKNFDYKTRKGGLEYLICNPFDADSGFKFNINPEKGSCHCWTGDEWAGPINPETGKRNCSFVKFVKIYRKCSYTDAIKEILGTSEDLKAYLRPENRLSDGKSVRKVAVALPDGTEPLIRSKDPQAQIVIRWLCSRGYTLDDIEKYELHFIGVECYWPYYEWDELVYWQSRNRFNKVYRFPDSILFDKKGATVGETEGSKGDFLYGFDDVESASYLIITESIFGQYTLGEQALASGGASLTPKQIGKIKILGPKKGVILSPDNDKAGIKSIIANHKLLSIHGYQIFFSIPPKLEYTKNNERKFTKDWNELIEELKMSRAEVRAIHDKHMQRVSVASLSKLLNRLPRKQY